MRKMLAVVLAMMVTACSGGGASANITGPPPPPPPPPPPHYTPVAPFTVVATWDSVPVHFNVAYDLTAHVHLIVKDSNDTTVETGITFHSYVGYGGTNNVCQNSYNMAQVPGSHLSDDFIYSMTTLTCDNANPMTLFMFFIPDSVHTSPITWAISANAWTSAGTSTSVQGSTQLAMSLVP